MAEGQAVWGAEGESWKTGSEATEERKEAYVEWLLTPKAERKPQTKAEFADWLGVTTQTLRNYARDPQVQAALVKRGRAINKVERASDVLDALYRKATDPESGSAGVSAARVWLDWTDRQTSEVDVDLSELSNEELRELVARVYDEVDER